MAIEHKWERKGVVRRFVGRISGPEYADSAARVMADPRFDVAHYILNDFRQCSALEIDPDLIEEIAARAAIAVRVPHKFGIAVVTPEPRIRAVIDAFHEQEFIHFPIRAFDTEEDARVWLVGVEAGRSGD